uniref:Uncharacterized protein n=1 Tax=Rhizophora mucronata TaxID=61149 RepID=A0A2P2KPN1_RHIMU
MHIYINSIVFWFLNPISCEIQVLLHFLMVHLFIFQLRLI